MGILSTVKSPLKNAQLHNHNIHAGDQAQIVTLASVIPDDPCFVDSVDHVIDSEVLDPGYKNLDTSRVKSWHHFHFAQGKLHPKPVCLLCLENIGLIKS